MTKVLSSLLCTSVKNLSPTMIPPYVVSNHFIAYLYFDIVITNIPSLMHLVLVMCDASIVTVLICLKVNSCQIITKNSFNMYTRVRDEGNNIGKCFHVAASSMKTSLNARVLTARSSHNSPTMKIVFCLIYLVLIYSHDHC